MYWFPIQFRHSSYSILIPYTIYSSLYNLLIPHTIYSFLMQVTHPNTIYVLIIQFTHPNTICLFLIQCLDSPYNLFILHKIYSSQTIYSPIYNLLIPTQKNPLISHTIYSFLTQYTHRDQFYSFLIQFTNPNTIYSSPYNLLIPIQFTHRNSFD